MKPPATTPTAPSRLRPYHAVVFALVCTFALLSACLLSAQDVTAQKTPPVSREAAEFFESKVRPLLVEHCYQCHSASTNVQMGGLRLDSRVALLKGGNTGPVVVTAHPAQSLLLKAVSYHDKKLQMPPKGKMTADEIETLTRWVKMGAPWPVSAATPNKAPGFNIEERAKHWSFQPIRRQAVPTVKKASWPRNEIDRFVLAKLEANGLAPAPPAEKLTLLRRVTYDLTGLPPTIEEINAFLADTSPTAYEKVVDRLLASPHYGERWARHWLDLARFAETDGHEFDFEKPGAYHYRDYVIRALNADVPYDQFVKEHVAGDLLPQPRVNTALGLNESVIGTGFWWFGEGKHSPVDLLVDEVERVDNQIDVFSKTFLGVSVGCARCHDHKFDPISTKDYYALSGYMKSSRFDLVDAGLPDKAQAAAKSLAELDAQIQPADVAEVVRGSLAEAAGVRTASARPTTVGVQGDTTAWLATLAARDQTGPFAPLVPLLQSAPTDFAQARTQALSRLNDQGARAATAERGLTVFEDFRSRDYAGWFVTGQAFGQGPAQPGSAKVSRGLSSGDALYVEYVRPEPCADSGRLSDALTGTLRSRTFLIEKPKILYRMAGKDCQVNLIIDGFQRIRDPIYGGLTITPKSDGRRWYVQDVSKWVGHRAYIEIVDRGSGWIAVDRIAFGDGAAPEKQPNPLVTALLSDASVDSADMLSTRTAGLIAQVLKQWSDGTLTKQPDAAARIDLINARLPLSLVGLSDEKDAVPAKLKAVVERKREVEAGIPRPVYTMAFADGTGEDDRVHIRGSHKELGPVVPRRFLEVCGATHHPDAGSGRLELANRLVSPTNPLLARVIVNRLWKHHFTEGIVRTPDDFGIMGQRPTHPELLDWLASELVKQGWSLKKMHRMMVLSNTYRMSSKPSAKADEADPENKLLHRMPVRRLEAEAVRDAVLAVSGRLNRKLFGPSVMPYLTSFMQGRGRPEASGPLDGNGRRSIYISVRRNFLTPLFVAFDYPVPFSTMGKRTVSNVPAQALVLLNNPFVVQQAGVWAERLAVSTVPSRDKVRDMYLTDFGRPPTATELNSALAFLSEQDARHGKANSIQPWKDLCHVLFNVKEFIFIQ